MLIYVESIHLLFSKYSNKTNSFDLVNLLDFDLDPKFDPEIPVNSDPDPEFPSKSDPEIIFTEPTH